MDIYKLNWTQLEQEIFSLLCLRAGEKLSQREIAKILKVSPTTIKEPARKLKEKNLIKIEKTKTINFISFNRDEEKAINLKRAQNLKNTYTTGLTEHLKNELPGSTIIIFGSYSRGEDTNNSDIDIAVIERKEKKLTLNEYEKKLNRKININYYKTLKEINPELKNNILNGIIINGSVEL